MKKSNIAGWKDVFTFTFMQTIKSKAFIISFVIFLFLSMISMPIINIMTSSNTEDMTAPSPVHKVYVNNQSQLPQIDFTGLLADENMDHISFVELQESMDEVTARIEDNENTSVLLTVNETEGVYFLDFMRASHGPVKDKSLHQLADAVSEQFSAFRVNALGITDEQLTMIYAEVNTHVTMLDVNGQPVFKEDTSISNSEYWFIYGLLFVVLMVNVMASSNIASAIVTEKSTRVLEYLLTSVRPLALMVGKIIAMLLAVVLELIAILLFVLLSNSISAALSSNGKTPFQYLPPDIFQNINLLNIVLCLIILILGMVFYATLAGLAGATVSRQEEISEGLTLFSFTNMIGAYIGIGAAMVMMGSGMNGFVYFAYLFPLSSPFLLPGSILVGKVGIPILLSAILLQLLSIILLFRFVAKVYEFLIHHNGNKIKMKELLKLSKTV